MAKELPPFEDRDAFAANAAGELSPAQREALAQRRFGAILATALVGGGLLLAALVFVMSALERAREAGGASSPGVSAGALVGAALLGAVVLAFAWIVCLQAPRAVTLSRELRRGELARATCAVAWRRDGYYADVPERRFWGDYGVCLEPGRYTWHYLAASGQLLSAARVDDEDSRPAQRQALRDALGSSEAALLANQRGQLHPEQARRLLLRRLLREALWLLLVGVTPLLLAALVASADPISEVWWLVSLLAGVGLWLSVRVARRVMDVIRDVRGGAVARHSGRAQKRIETRTTVVEGKAHTTVQSRLMIGERAFEHSRALYNALLPGAAYTVYFGPRTEVIVGVELAAADDAVA